jgi:hypothetical protein
MVKRLLKRHERSATRRSNSAVITEDSVTPAEDPFQYSGVDPVR